MDEQERIWNIEYRNHESKWKKERHSIPKILKGRRVLEIGVGNGKSISEVLKQKPLVFTAVDFSGEAVSGCKRKFGDKKINLLKRDIRDTGFKDGAFDVVLCYYVLNNLLEKDRKIVTSEIFRLLSKGGVVLFEDFMNGDLRQKLGDAQLVEENTELKKNGLRCHFFSKKEIRLLFKKFKISKLEEKSFKVIVKKPLLRRKLLFMSAKK